ncbi:hypothetical protein NEMIN01_1540 [Nematocida minor]|uniref:uncharacterized protein n=1 Tax=Nematocida minor TaxID=1912983 RepID=UPI00221FE2A3|nr:uncharacterized protein NEMIN01_1540 [Nematocida minor]KAI5191514.1 hypothetical protein NEMIN01_1540 [Nematocida minor]
MKNNTMTWTNSTINIQDSEAYSKIIHTWGTGDSIKGLLLGMASAPLLLVSVYFFKASPRFFSKEHGISLLAYMSSAFLASLGILLFGLPIIITSFQVLPILNQIFVSSFTLTIETVSAIALTIISIYLSVVGYRDIEQSAGFSWISIIMFLVILALAIMRLSSHGDAIRRKFELEKVSDLTCMLVLSFEAAVGFGALCSFSYIFTLFLPVVAVLTSMSFLLSIEKALYYYPATAVIPIFTVFLRVFGAAISVCMYSKSFNPFVLFSLITGAVSSIFPLILA